MAIQVTCPGCGKRVECKDHLAGKRVRCPGCQGPIAVPGPAEEKPSEAAAASHEVVAVEDAADPSPEPLPFEIETADRPGPAAPSRRDAHTTTGRRDTRATTGRRDARTTKDRSTTRSGPAVSPTVLIAAGIALGVLAVGFGTYFIVKSQRQGDKKELLAEAAPAGKTTDPASGKSAGKQEESAGETAGTEVREPGAPLPEEKQAPATPPEETKPAEPPPEPSQPEPPIEPSEPEPSVEPPAPQPEPKADPPPPLIDVPKFEIITPSKPPPSAEPGPDQPEAKDEPAEPKAEPEEPKGPKRKPRRPRQKSGEKEPPAVVGPPDPNCPLCHGLGVVPFEKPVPYVHVEGMPAPKPELAVPDRYCPKCQAGRDPAELVEVERKRLAIAGQAHQQWEQKLQTNLLRVENHHVTIHAQLPPNEVQTVGAALEMMTAHLQQLTGSMELTPTRPDTYEILIILGKPNYLAFLRLMQAEWQEKAGNDWALLPEVGGGTVDNTSFFRYVPGQSPPPAHMAIFMAASQQVSQATGHHAPIWLQEGFSAYCENVVLKKNLVHSVEYEITQLRIDPNWALAIRQLAAMGQLKPWAAVASLELREYKPIDYVTCYGMVAFLIQSDPKKFLDFTRKLRDGLVWTNALEQAYGENVDKLQKRWVAWLTGRG